LAFSTELLETPAVVMANQCNMFTPTEKLEAMGEEEMRKVLESNHSDHHKMAQEGLLRLDDAVMAVAQTREQVCTCLQRVVGDELVGQPRIGFTSQKNFDGNAKMYRSVLGPLGEHALYRK
jgi:hypothetical protein